ncbi:DUF3857 domain-containing transglutaminase family protein [Flavobacterium sp.]|uniref:DUF3857 domain-containing transglutaminase family protein n=1 Tax=Flavobacterium sp. TaxID=239 RepID=UPI0025C0E2AF|nr:DUF3857 domain-containing transglutaminase family protein [Flavobacterium sp.]
MDIRYLFFFALSLVSTFGFGQKLEYSTLLIPAELKENANAVMRSSEESYTINSQNSVTCKISSACTVLNEYGLRHARPSQYYSPTLRISKIEARVYDAMGKEIKVFKKKDFRDVSLGDGFSVFNDDRMLYLDYTPIGYPFTMVFDCEYTSTNTAQLPRWSALGGYFVSTEKDHIEINYPPNLGFGYKELNFEGRFDIKKEEQAGKISFTATKIPALKGEADSPPFYKVCPMVNFRLDKFSLEGVQGEASNWKDFGKWYYDKLLVGTDELSPETQIKVKQLVGDEKDQLKIARKIYQYVQDKTRYVSIQVGIGGYKPMKASDVDKLGYGDCKALSNYTRSLLAVAGIPSYFTLVYSGGESRRGLLPDFVSPQGDHVILAMPHKDNYVWMECTSQTAPFGFQGTFTDGRNVLVIKPEGGEIVRTGNLVEKDNSQILIGKYSLTSDGAMTGLVSTMSSGGNYDGVFSHERLSPKDQEKYFKEQFSHLNSLKLEKVDFRNDKDAVKFTENVNLFTPAYANVSGNRLLFAVNAFSPFTDTPKRYRNRQNPFELERGFFEDQEIEITIPDGYDVEALPSDANLKTQFGEYESKITKKSANTLVYKRSFLMKDGVYPNTEYENYRQFCEQVAKFDAAKAVLVKKT